MASINFNLLKNIFFQIAFAFSLIILLAGCAAASAPAQPAAVDSAETGINGEESAETANSDAPADDTGTDQQASQSGASSSNQPANTATPVATSSSQTSTEAASATPTSDTSPADNSETGNAPVVSTPAAETEAEATPTATSSAGTETETTPAIATPDAGEVLLPAPALLEPGDGMVFSGFSANVPLKWSAVKPALGRDELYLVRIKYNFQGQIYTDYAWTQQTGWAVENHAYLVDLSDDGLFIWSVMLIRQTGLNSDGIPEGTALSAPSQEQSFIWTASSAPAGGSDSDDDDDDDDDDRNSGGGYP